jgi:hypothetical protein
MQGHGNWTARGRKEMMLFYIALTLPLIAFGIAADAMLRTWLLGLWFLCAGAVLVSMMWGIEIILNWLWSTWPQMPEPANPAAAISGTSIAAICVLAILSGLVAAFCTRDCWKVRFNTERTRI